MNAFLQQLRISLKLHYRNKMALIYSYLFPLIFLLAFWVLYRHETVTLARHMGEWLSVSVLGGACFGLPTTMVSERERGVWRRYRLTPVPTAALVASTAAARYFILITAGLLQLAMALALGMPLPKHPVDLLIVFTFVSFAFIGLGLVMAMMADNVPAVQALGQCIFLPMLIIGGIAVPLASLPDWALHVSAFFPGRYAVEALQACVIGTGLGATRFDLLALLIIGAGGYVAGAKMFRWDAQQRFAAR
jgi:ABC-type multidrug transport system permease subunit